jgi:DNA mismatch repair protein MutL
VRERGANTQEEWRAQIALSLAEKTAIPYGKTLTIEEMRDLIKRLFQLGNLRTPKGKKILHLLSDEDINKLF